MVTDRERQERAAKEDKIRKWMDMIGHDLANDEIFDLHALGNSPILFGVFVDYMVGQKMKELHSNQKKDGLDNLYR